MSDKAKPEQTQPATPNKVKPESLPAKLRPALSKFDGMERPTMDLLTYVHLEESKQRQQIEGQVGVLLVRISEGLANVNPPRS